MPPQGNETAKKISVDLQRSIETVSEPWKTSPYYEEAEKWLHAFWDKDSVFKQLFDELDLTHVVELAAGHGRHAEVVAEQAGQLIVMDIFEENLNVCRQRLKRFSNVICQKCQGAAFDEVGNEWATAIYCYDAMVHFSPDIVESYLQDTYRILRQGGRALYHHSNYSAATEQHYGSNPHARNNMSQVLFAELCEKANLHIRKSVVISWGGVEDLDCISLLEKE
jgi:ubiquinone/menaquinone biosynthesis C-methylase UbiE